MRQQTIVCCSQHTVQQEGKNEPLNNRICQKGLFLISARVVYNIQQGGEDESLNKRIGAIGFIV